jgi:serine protease Do
LTSYRDVVKRVLPAVVSIEARAKPAAQPKQPAPPRQRRPRFEDFPIPEEFRRFFDELEQRQFEMPDDVPHAGFGSGFLVDPKGVILTNFHVVAGADQVEVQLKDGRRFVSKDIRGDRKNDLAIVRIEAQSPLPYLELGDSDAIEIGDRVLAVGAPFGLVGSVTHGIISGKDRNGLNRTRSVFEDYVQTDAPINPGNSGGPLVNLEGKVVGINTAIKSRTGGFQGVGLAISSNLAKNIVQQLVRDGVVRRGYLGVRVGELTADVASQLGLADRTGVVVAQVYEGSPAGKAGLQDGDVVTAVAGKPVHDGRDLQRLVAGLPLNKAVDVTVVRDGKTRILPVTIAEQPDDYGLVRQTAAPLSRSNADEGVQLDKVGLEVAELTAENASRFGHKDTAAGVVITAVEPGSLGDQAGLRRGMLLVRVDKKPVSSAAEVRQLLEKASFEKGVLFQVQYPPNLGGGMAYLVLKAQGA